MGASSVLRQQIEAVLANRIPHALSPTPHIAPCVMPSGIHALDEILGGGLPVGVLTEFVGPECCGRTAAAMAYIAVAMRAGGVCAWIDVADTLDPETASANGLDLERLLWVRCGSSPASVSPTLLPTEEQWTLKPTPTQAAAGYTGGGSPHPRSEARGMPQAVSSLLDVHRSKPAVAERRRDRSIGTPGVPNRPLTQRPLEREEQIATDRLPARRGENLKATLAYEPRCAEPQPRRIPQLAPKTPLTPYAINAVPAFPAMRSSGSGSWQALDQALRTADLLLQNGGFGVIVLDLGSTPPERAWRIPLATWFRFRSACERTRVSLLLLTQHPCARSSAELVVRMEVGQMEADVRVMTGLRYRAERERQRGREPKAKLIPMRKPPQPERPGQWQSRAAWAQTR